MTTSSAAAAATDNVSPPRRFIFIDVDMNEFIKSDAKRDLLRFVNACGKSCSTPGNDYDPSSPLEGLPPALASLHGSLRNMETWLLDLPPQKNAQARFGNPVFKKWHERLVSRSQSIVESILACHKEYPTSTDTPISMEILQACSEKGYQAASIDESQSTSDDDDDDDANVVELRAYLHDGFGHAVRLDYGTGHESSFMVFLYALLKLGCYGNPSTEPPSMECLKASTLSIWTQYLAVTRGLQMDYMLEPAGSHGVWGLDDYHCLPFYFGASQLIPHSQEYTPESIHDKTILERESSKYLYFGCIQYIQQLKKNVPFFESSPMLNDISHLPTWAKVANGLLKLYQGEVLDKRQVVQHFVFGNIFKASWKPSQVEQQAPTGTFRAGKNDAPVPPTRAPWAK